MLFNNPYTRNHSIPEINSGEIIVESAGYIPAKVQIENMIFAGQRLAQARKEEFGGLTDDEALKNFNPTQNPNFDIVDAHKLLNSEIDRLESKSCSPNVGGTSGNEPKIENPENPDDLKKTGEKEPV